MTDKLKFDPYNLIITGVGGQGNVMASRVLGKILSNNGYTITIGETFGVSQRGGSVMSHLRISSDSVLSPQVAKGRAHMIVALEPTEALRVLADYGNDKVKVICNNRPIYSVGVISGEQAYPEKDQIQGWIRELSAESWFLDATDEALKRMNNPIFGNIILMGALAATNSIPLDRNDFEAVISESLSKEKVEINMEAYDLGSSMIAEV
jgi:indolepyruvate ferredoxin oxidoreductase, beta subunit